MTELEMDPMHVGYTCIHVRGTAVLKPTHLAVLRFVIQATIGAEILDKTDFCPVRAITPSRSKRALARSAGPMNA
jgi:hypothetical protein